MRPYPGSPMLLKSTSKCFALLVILLNLQISPASARSLTSASPLIPQPKDLFKITIPGDDSVITTSGLATRLALPSRTFNFLVWNIHKGSDKTFRPEFLLMAYSRHIILTQEMYSAPVVTDTLKLLPHYYSVMATSFISGKEALKTGVATLSPVKPEITKFIRTKNLEPVLRTPKISLVTSYPIAFSRS
jgi:endonuclease/exonuclease/phosphatase (EEP) superfamily protein YafD